MPSLNSPIVIRNFTVKNRIVLPPLVIVGTRPSGAVNTATLNHYESFARGGCGTVIVEATSVKAEGRLDAKQLGLWDDAQIDGMKAIAERVIPHGALLLVQINHASTEGIPDNVVPVGPSAYTNQDGLHRALTTAEVEHIRDCFVAAAARAEKAGFHGVELHGAHGFLLCAFMNAAYNRRDDRYGDLTLLPREIIAGIRQVTSSGFILTARVGADNPDMKTGIANCKLLEAAGLDYLDISNGVGREGPLPVPEGFPFAELTWRGCEIKKHVKIPVIAVGGLNDPVKAKKLIEEGWADFAAVGRGMLADPEWANKVLAGEPVNRCYDCKKGCLWFEEHEKCPGRRKPSPQ